MADDLNVNLLTFENENVLPDSFPRLSCKGSNQLSLEKGGLRLDRQQEIFFGGEGKVRSQDDSHMLFFNREQNLTELHESGDIVFLTGGSPATERMRIKSDGNVGVGVSFPTEPLEVAGFIRVSDGLDSNAGNRMQVGTRQAQPLELVTSDKVALTIDAAGKVGIGTTMPNHRLSISNGPTWTTNGWGGAMELENGNAIGWKANAAGNQFGTGHSDGGFYFFRTTSSPGTAESKAIYDLFIDDSGRVGIGTTEPTQKLHVAGDFITVNGLGGEQAYIGGIGAADLIVMTEGEVRVGSFNPAVTDVRFWNGSNGENMNIYANDIIFNGKLHGGGKGGYVMDQFINNLNDALETGDVVVVGSNQSSLYYGPHENIPIPEVDLTTEAYHTGVCGVVCEVYGELREQPEGQRTRAKESEKSEKVAMRPQPFSDEEMERLDYTQVQPGQIGWMVTLGAFAHCKVDADIAPIKIGDLLTTSLTRGHAQKVLDRAQGTGAILGKALASLSQGKGKIPVMVMLQ